MRERRLHIDLREFIARLATERPATRGEVQRGELAPGRLARPQALVQRAVLAVDRHNRGTRCRAQRCDHGAGSDEAFLVGEGEALAASQCVERDGQTGEPDDGVHHHICVANAVSDFGDELSAAEFARQFAAHFVVDHADHARLVCGDLLAQHALIRRGREADHLEPPGARRDDVECLATDRTGAARQGNLDAHAAAIKTPRA